MNKFLASAMMIAAPLIAMSEAHAAPGGGTPPPPAPVPTSFTAGATVYSSRAAFNTAVDPTVTDDFNIASASDGGIGALAFPSGVYTDPNGTQFAAPTLGSVVNLNILDTTYLNGSNMILKDFGSDVISSNTEALTVTFAAPITSFAIDFASLGRGFVGQSDLFSFTIAGYGSYQTYSNSSATLNFFGVSTANAFNSITITSSNTGNGNVSRYFDNASIGVPAAPSVPEPASWAMMILGMGAIGFAMRGVALRSERKFDARINRLAAGDAVA